jgi:hypothetical protein
MKATIIKTLPMLENWIKTCDKCCFKNNRGCIETAEDITEVNCNKEKVYFIKENI